MFKEKNHLIFFNTKIVETQVKIKIFTLYFAISRGN